MKRLLLKKLIVISRSEQSSLEVPFKKGLNIILGGNKTGKSSLIKSIFTALGCDCSKIEKDWKNLISTYLLYFKYGDEQYCVLRCGKEFSIMKEEKNNYTCVINTEKFQLFCDKLMEIFEVNMQCVISNNSEIINVTTPLLFRFQYIDQDDGWSDIGNEFKNVRYIKDWKGDTNKFITGYLNNDYYKLKAKKIQLSNDKEEKLKELKSNEMFVNSISHDLKKKSQLENLNQLNTVDDVQKKLIKLRNDTDDLRKKEYSIKEKMIKLDNNIFMKKIELNNIYKNIEETQKDISFAMEQDEEIICPICGTKHKNSLNEQLNLSAGLENSEKLRNILEDKINNFKEQLMNFNNEYEDIKNKILKNEELIKDSKEMLSYEELYKNKGKYELYNKCKQELVKIESKYKNLIGEIGALDEQIKEIKSKKRKNEITMQLKDKCKTFAEKINLPLTYIKFRDLVQVIDHTGSETPRLVYMYQSALYLYNLERGENPFNFYVIDTPNQQGQDEDNLECIFKSMELLLSNKGQVIVGTERKTGLEEKANNIINLSTKRKCLNSEKYNEHINQLQSYQQIITEYIKRKEIEN
ncbi:hypothetical protein OCV55_09895 [Clostridium ammoniilyticum]|uniref:Rad50/SbcC-type AAA domain-containing protein n=1 Tax=[Clostridium] ammoniilyticum TaxID=2981784 RepID=A0ABT2SX79_9FIRM|nr:hypothetical protein [[Clostridium] ammoniilyticum]MCU6738978.1 hypothetical protein [[Clostridium] ammoniilyticum]SCH94727.1 chromosome segregation protein [uncultured Clostridium sp.]